MKDATVLLVEFDGAERDRLGACLSEAGFDVLSCPGPTEPDYTCIGVREKRCPLAQAADVVVVDLLLGSDTMMRGSPGWEMCLFYYDQGLPIVALTGVSDPIVPTADERVRRLSRHPMRAELVATVREMVAQQVHGNHPAG